MLMIRPPEPRCGIARRVAANTDRDGGTAALDLAEAMMHGAADAYTDP